MGPERAHPQPPRDADSRDSLDAVTESSVEWHMLNMAGELITIRMGRHHRARAPASPRTVLDLRPRQRRRSRADPPSDAARDRRPSGRAGDPAVPGIPLPAGHQPACRRRADSRPPGDELLPVPTWRTGIRGTGKCRDLDGADPSVRSAWCTPAQSRADWAGVSDRAWYGRTRTGRTPDRVVSLSGRGVGDGVPRYPAAGLPHGPLRFQPPHQHARLSAAGPRLPGARLSPLRGRCGPAPLPQSHGVLSGGRSCPETSPR